MTTVFDPPKFGMPGFGQGQVGEGLVGVGPTTPTNADLPAAQQSAKAILDGALSEFGLQSLSTTIWGWYLQGRPIEQIMLDLRTTPEYKQRFPAMETLAQKGRAISEQQYIDYERGAAQLFQSAGLPTNFYDQPDDFAKFLTNEIALPELQQRIALYQTAAYQAPQQVRDELQSRYGVTDGELTGFFIDPNKALPLIQQRFGAAQAAGHSNLSGFGALTQAEAERVGRQGLTEQQLAQGFGELGHLAPLFEALPGSAEDTLLKTTGIAAEFDSDAQAQRELQRRAALRKGEFAEGGQFGSSQQGFTGTGSA